jgi:DtxR family Mn-dependent transcriptional regulator
MSSRSIEEYLEAIYRLSIEEAPVKTSRLAEYLGVAPSSVTEMIKKMSELGYVEYSPYRGVVLTESGRSIGEKITRRHRLFELFLTKVLGINRDLAHNEACEVEHSISDETEKSLCRFLGSPNTCPHGRVIPACDLDVSTCEECISLNSLEVEKVGRRRKSLVPLTWLREGSRGVIEFIRGEHKTLRRLLDMGLTPGTRISVIRTAPMNGPVEIFVRGSRLAIGKEIASNIFVSMEKRGESD